MFSAAKVPARAPFRLRPVKLSAPTGRQAFLAHGEACLPGLVLGEGDVLCVGGPAGPGAVEVFAPVVLGHPMLGQVVKQQLCSLPGGIPCAARHWESQGAVRAVWRSLAEPRPLGAAPADGSSGAPARRAICVRVPAPAVGLTRAAHPEWMGRPMQLVERGAEGGAVPTLVFTGIGGVGPAPVPVPAPLPSSAALASAAALVADLLGAGAEIEEASPSELRVVAHLSLDLRAATALAYRLGRQVRLPLSVAVADDLAEARHLARRLGPDQLLFVLAGIVANEVANEPAQRAPALQVQHLPATTLALAAAPAPTAIRAVSRRAMRHVPPAEGPVQLRLFGGVEAA